MIRPLRQRHHQIFVAIGLLLPVLFAFGIAAPKPFPTMDSLPQTMSAPTDKFVVCAWERAGLFAKSPVQVRLLRKNLNGGVAAVAFSANPNYFIQPDLMVYWLAGNPSITDRLPDQATLLGEFDSAALPLPAAAAVTNGVLVLYSLANKEIVDVSKPIQFNDSTN
jgi:hypothetical protein